VTEEGLLKKIGKKAIFAIQGYDYDQDWSNVASKFVTEKGQFNDAWVADMQQRIYPTMLKKGQIKPWEEGDLKKGRQPDKQIAERMDQMLLATGQKQMYGTMKSSDYRPSKGAEKDEKFFAYREPDRIAKVVSSFYDKFSQMEKGKMYNVGYESDVKKGDATFVNPGVIGMGRFQIGLGEDDEGEYMALYDKWDIEPKGWGRIGKYLTKKAIPGFEMYDRYYYGTPESNLELRREPMELPHLKEIKRKPEDMIMDFMKRLF